MASGRQDALSLSGFVDRGAVALVGLIDVVPFVWSQQYRGHCIVEDLRKLFSKTPPTIEIFLTLTLLQMWLLYYTMYYAQPCMART